MAFIRANQGSSGETFSFIIPFAYSGYANCVWTNEDNEIEMYLSSNSRPHSKSGTIGDYATFTLSVASGSTSASFVITATKSCTFYHYYSDGTITTYSLSSGGSQSFTISASWHMNHVFRFN